MADKPVVGIARPQLLRLTALTGQAADVCTLSSEPWDFIEDSDSTVHGRSYKARLHGRTNTRAQKEIPQLA